MQKPGHDNSRDWEALSKANARRLNEINPSGDTERSTYEVKFVGAFLLDTCFMVQNTSIRSPLHLQTIRFQKLRIFRDESSQVLTSQIEAL